eukprot:TRINITY_DN766_c0_g1_i2.p1 TRINITY_DN766_c0_g1~~TRINITY_DN766_c0_g1_i2.p1  ORF type:complete len:719 (-),score=99.47 TRINITY_DN766_c0_g1_i2:266-2422(-)
MTHMIRILMLFLCILCVAKGQSYINIGALMTIAEVEAVENPNYSGAFAEYGRYAINAWKLWQKMANEQGGIPIGGVDHLVNITYINIGEDPDKIRRVTNQTCLGAFGDFDLLFAPFGSDFTEIVAEVTQRYNKILLAGHASSKTLYECGDGWESLSYCTGSDTKRFKHLFGVLRDGGYYYEGVLDILRLKDVQTILSWGSNTIFNQGVLEGAETLAIRNGITPIDRIATDVIPTDEQLENIINIIEQERPDIVLGSPREANGCISYIKKLKERNITAGAFLLSQCVSNLAVLEEIGDDIRYFIDFVSWDLNVRGSEYTDSLYFPPTDDTTSAQLFSQAFVDEYGEGPDLLVSPSAFLLGEVVYFGYSKAGTKDPEAIREQLPFVLETTYFGTIGFNVFGINDKTNIPSIQKDSNGTSGIISPLGSSTLNLIYPFPGWEERETITGYLSRIEEIVIFVLTVVLGLFSVIMGILILSFKKQFYSIRASSPTFILLMLVGSLIMYGGALSWTMWMNQFLCIAKNWFLGLGFVLLFGTLVAKTHRIKKIFLFKTLTVKIISDGQLYMIVGVFVLIEIAINACWTIFTLPNSIEIIVDENRPVYNYYTCTTSDLDSIFLIVSLVYKGLLVLYSLYLSTLLWKHKKSALIESREIIFCIYNLTIFGAIFAAVQASLESTTSRSLLFLLRSSCILFSTFVTVATLTMPKLIKPERGSNYNYKYLS